MVFLKWSFPIFGNYGYHGNRGTYDKQRNKPNSFLYTQTMKRNGLIFYADNICSDTGQKTYEGMIIEHKWKIT